MKEEIHVKRVINFFFFKKIEVKKAMPKNKQNRMVAPALNPNFRPPTGYMPNNRYAAQQFGMMNRNNFMYGNMYGGAAPYNAMAYYQTNRPYNNNYMRQPQNYDGHQQQHDDTRADDRKDRGGGAIHASQSRNQQHYRPY